MAAPQNDLERGRGGRKGRAQRAPAAPSLMASMTLSSVKLAAFWRVVGKMGAAGQGRGPERPASPSRSGPALLVRCASCGTHFPEARALRHAKAGDAVFCSEECLARVGSD